MPATPDERSNRDVMRQWERLKTVRSDLIKMGKANGDTSPAECVAILRAEIPADLFAGTAKKD